MDILSIKANSHSYSHLLLKVHKRGQDYCSGDCVTLSPQPPYPYLFVIVMDYIMRISLTVEDGYTVRRRMSARHPAIRIPALAYADDAALLSDNAESAQRQLHRFETASAKVGLCLNASKTKVMFVGVIPYSDIHTVSGTTLAACDESATWDVT